MEYLHSDPRLSVFMQCPNLTEKQSSTFNIDVEKDNQIISNWLLQRGKFNSLSFTNTGVNNGDVITITTAQKALRNSLEIVRKLKQTQEKLKRNVDTMSSSDWKQKTQDIGNLKDQLDKTMLIFEGTSTLASLKYKIKKRAKKRLNQKQWKLNLVEARRIEAKEQVKEHKRIDEWLERKKDESERLKMEERMKKDADCVLYEVTRKKSEARKQLSLITAMVKLRSVRDHMAMQRGEKTSVDDRTAFGSVTEKLIRMWENEFQTYLKEEECLNVMLEHNAVKDSQTVKSAREAYIVEQWHNLIFGHKNVEKNQTYWALTCAERDVESFIAIRKSWDTFLVNQGSGSSIPIGWVLPPTEADSNWAKYGKKSST